MVTPDIVHSSLLQELPPHSVFLLFLEVLAEVNDPTAAAMANKVGVCLDICD
jgi:hypothetical protein